MRSGKHHCQSLLTRKFRPTLPLISLILYMNIRSGRFDLDWWVIPKRFVYIAGSVMAFTLLVGGVIGYLWLHGNPFGSHKTEESATAGARFISFDGEVRVVRANTREVHAARANVQLYPGDIVQTQTDGRALILLVDGSKLLVRPNSVVIIRDNTSVAGGTATRVRVAVDRGQINVRTEQQTEGTSNVVETKLTENKLAAQTGASFGVRDDNTEDIRVSSGQLETNTRGGDRTVVRGGEYVSLNQSGGVARRERLLDVPALVAPRDLEKIFAGPGGAGAVWLRWQRPAAENTSHYRVEVATSPFFVAAGKVIERDQLETTALNAGDLRPGIYFWRVRAVAPSGQASEWTDIQKFNILTSDSTGEPVRVSDLSAEHVAGGIYLVRGRSSAGTTIRVGSRTTLAATDGRFQLQISVSEGQRAVAVEAEDTQGNKHTHQLALSAGSSSG